jgi:hypothetical protein
MPSTLRTLALALGLVAVGNIPPVIAAAKEKSVSSSDGGSPLERVGYRPAPGAQLIGEAVQSPSGDDVAFFEQNGELRELVVCPRGATPGRWTVKAETTKLRIFWSGPTQLVLGSDILAPRMVVRWSLARL